MQPNTYLIDNEASEELKTAMKKRNVDFQLVPPHIHRANLAERAIQTFKHHFKAGLASVDPNFPLAEWDRLLPQATLTLNLLRSARSNPKLSAHAYLFGEFNFNATPLAPPGTKVLMHKQVDNRTSWGPHGREAWYIGPSLNHYRCVKCFVTDTRKELDSDTVTFFPKNIKFPAVTTDDFLRQSALDIISILSHPPPSTVPTLEAGDETRNALLKIAEALHRITALPKNLEPPPANTNISDPVPSTQEQILVPPPVIQEPVVAPPRVVPDQTPPRVVLDQAPEANLQQPSWPS